MSDNAAHGRTTVARCSTCRVMILEGLEHCNERSELERAITGPLRFVPEVRLACQTKASGESAERTTGPRMAAYGTFPKCRIGKLRSACRRNSDVPASGNDCRL